MCARDGPRKDDLIDRCSPLLSKNTKRKKSTLVRRTGFRHFAADSDRPTILSNRNLPVGPILGLNHALGELFPEKNLLDRQERVVASFDSLPDS